jgi:hypothetical protein
LVAVGGGPTATAAAVNGLGVHDDGGGAALYVGGNLISAGGQPANRIAKWDGAAWSPLGAGLNQASQAMASFDDGSGTRLFVGGSFSLAANVPNTAGITSWNGSQWFEVGGGVAGSVNVLVVHDDGTGAALYAGGTFVTAGTAPPVPGTSRIAKWDGTTWSPLGSGMDGPSNPRVNHIAAYDDGSGMRLFAGGLFTTAGGHAASNLASWDGAAWTEVGGGTDNTVIRMAVFNGGGGPALFVGGSFATVNTPAPIVVNAIARWDGEGWDDLDGGINSPIVTTASALAVFDDGSGSSLFVGGGFSTAGGQAAGNIVQWGCTACYPDCNKSGTLTISDFGCFQAAFAVGEPYADCNGSGTWTIADFGCFQGAFAAGCP